MTTANRAPMAPVDETDHVRGSSSPAVVLVEYGDYDCPHTRAAQAIVDRIVAENPDLQIAFRHFPLRYLHANAETLARIAEAADRQGKFWAMHDHLMHHRSEIDGEALFADAAASGVSMEELRHAVGLESVRLRVERDVDSGRASGVHSTPSFFFDGVLHDGRYDYDTLSRKLAEARARRSSGRVS